jgi:hypothetical protein
VAQRLHLDRLALQPEAAPEDSIPEIERLLDVGQVLGPRLPAVGADQAEADAAEVEPVGIGPQPIDLRRPAVARDVRVADLSPARVVLGEAEALVKANSPLPTDSGDSTSNALSTGSCRVTTARRSIPTGVRS